MNRLRKSLIGLVTVLMTASFSISMVTMASNALAEDAQDGVSYMELYSPRDKVKLYTSNAEYLTASIQNNEKTPSGCELLMSYTPYVSAVSVEIPLTVKQTVSSFEGLAFWVDVPETADEYSFTMYIVKSSNVKQRLEANKKLTLIDENGTVTEQVSVENDYNLNGFTGWVVLPEDAYADAEPVFGGQYTVVMEIKTAKTQAMELTLGSFGYYTDYYKFLAEYANVEGIAGQALKDIDGYIAEINTLRALTDRQIKLRDELLAEFTNLKENFKMMSDADQIETAINLEKEYQARVEDCLYGDIKKTNFIMSFAMVSDVHFSNTFFNPNFRNALEDAKALNPDLMGVFTLGDLADNGVSIADNSLSQLDDYYNWIDVYLYKNSKGEDIPIMNIMGNHDVRGAYKDPTGHYPTSSYEPAVQLYLEREGVDSLQHDKWINGYHFIFLNADRYERDDGYLNAETIDWLDEALSENEDGRPIFVMIHQPVGEVKTATDAKMTFQEVIACHPSAIVSSGHKHNAFGNNQIIQDGNGTYINQPSMMDEDIPGYYYVEVYEGGVVYRARDEVNDKWYYSSYVVVHNDTYVAQGGNNEENPNGSSNEITDNGSDESSNNSTNNELDNDSGTNTSIDTSGDGCNSTINGGITATLLALVAGGTICVLKKKRRESKQE